MTSLLLNFVGQATLVSTVAVASYQGPGDVVSGAVVFCGLRSYTSSGAGAGAAIIDVMDSSGANITTINAVSSGGLDTTALSNYITAHGAAYVSKLYDQTGNGKHMLGFSGPSNKVQVTLGGPGSYPTMVFVRANSQSLTTGGAVLTTQAQPFTMTAASDRTGDFTSYCPVFGDTTGAHGVGYGNNNNLWNIFFGTNQTPSGATDSTWIGSVSVVNGSSTTYSLNGTTGSTDVGSVGISSDILNIGTWGGSYMSGNIGEVGLWATAFSSTQASNMVSNIRTYWGF